MSNITMFTPGQLPAFVKNKEMSELAKALVGKAVALGKRISIKGGVFRLVADGKEVAAIDERYLDVVIVKAAPKVSRTWYAKTFDPKAETAAAPDCWSADGERPSDDSHNKQSVTCVSCPKNVAGSGQGNSRACRYQQRIAVVLANDIEGDVMQLTLPAASIFGKEEGDNRPLQAYAYYLVAQGADPSGLVTRMKFDTNSESPKLFFKPMRWLTEDEYATTQEKGASPDAMKAITMSVPKPKAETVRAALPAPVDDDEAAAPAPKAKAKVKAVEADDDEPVVRKETVKTNVVPAKKSDLAAMVSDWDDE